MKMNELLLKDPSLFSDTATKAISYPGDHNEGFPDTFKQKITNVYANIRQGNFDAKPDFPKFADRHNKLNLCEAIKQSSKEKRWITIN